MIAIHVVPSAIILALVGPPGAGRRWLVARLEAAGRWHIVGDPIASLDAAQLEAAALAERDGLVLVAEPLLVGRWDVSDAASP